MKKIIAIILGILMLFSVSVTSFALDTEAYIPQEETFPDYVVTIVYGGLDAEKVEVIEEGICAFYQTGNFTMNVMNNSNNNVKMSDFTLTATAYSKKDNSVIDEAEITYRELAESKMVIHTGGDQEMCALKARFKAFNSTDVYFMVSVNGLKAQKVTSETDTSSVAVFQFVDASKEEISTTETTTKTEVTTETTTVVETTTIAPETTTEAPVVNDETSTEAPETTTESVEKNELTTGDNVITTEKADDKVPSPTAPTYDTDDDYDYVEPEIPDTGISAAPFGAAGALVVSSITALIAKKRKLK